MLRFFGVGTNANYLHQTTKFTKSLLDAAIRSSSNPTVSLCSERVAKQTTKRARDTKIPAFSDLDKTIVGKWVYTIFFMENRQMVCRYTVSRSKQLAGNLPALPIRMSTRYITLLHVSEMDRLGGTHASSVGAKLAET